MSSAKFLGNFSNLLIFIFKSVSFLIHLVKGFKFFIWSSQHLIKLSIIRNFILIVTLFFIFDSNKVFKFLTGLCFCSAVVEHSSLNNFIVKVIFVSCSWQYSFFYWSFGNESKHSDFISLTNSMSSILCLKIHFGIPIWIKYDDSVWGLKIKTLPSCSGWQKKDHKFGLVIIEDFHR